MFPSHDHIKPMSADNTHICSACQGEGSVGDCRIDYDDEVQYWCWNDWKRNIT